MIAAALFVAALVLSLVITPTVRYLAIRLGFIDRPDGGRKTHRSAIALGGGAAVLLATLGAIGLGLALSGPEGAFPSKSITDSPFYAALLAAAITIVVVGLIDDLTAMKGHVKLAGQIVAVGILIYFGGIEIEMVSLLGYTFEFGSRWIALGFTMAWLLGAINAINLIDGIDGLASSVGFVLCLALAALTAFQGNLSATVVILALAGSLLGFLRYNFAPASIFLGDAGSMLIGLVVGAVAINHQLKSAATFALAVPFAVWSIPLLDSLAAILRRKLTGRSLFAADRGHLHHSLLVRGWTVRQAVLFISLICATTCVAALVCVYVDSQWSELIALGTVGAVVAFLISTKTFGHIEFALLRDHVRLTAKALASRETDRKQGVQERRIRLQGSDAWERLWTGLTESADSYEVSSIRLTIDIPALHESFFASWSVNRDSKNGDKTSPSWSMESPLKVDGMVVGRLQMTGAAEDKPTLAHMAQVLDFAEPIEEDIRQILQDIRRQSTAETAVDPVESNPDETIEPLAVSGRDAESKLATVPPLTPSPRVGGA